MGTDQYPDTTEKARVLLGNYKPPRQKNVIESEMMEEFPSSREDEGILEDADAAAEGAAVEVQAGATRPLSQPSTKKGVLHVPIAMERLISSTVGNRATGETCAPSYLKSNIHSSK